MDELLESGTFEGKPLTQKQIDGVRLASYLG